MPIYNAANSVLTERVQNAFSRPDTIEFKSRTLNGKYHVQTIGTAGVMADVIAHFTMAQKLVFDNIKKTAATIKVVFDNRYYVGIIDGPITWNRAGSSGPPLFVASFVLLVDTEGEVT